MSSIHELCHSQRRLHRYGNKEQACGIPCGSHQLRIRSRGLALLEAWYLGEFCEEFFNDLLARRAEVAKTARRRQTSHRSPPPYLGIHHAPY